METYQTQPKIAVQRLIKRYGTLTVLDGVDLAVGAGELVTLLGASGSGKSTIFNIIAGLDTPTDGTILFDGLLLTPHQPDRRKRVAYMPQRDALFAWRTILDNTILGLEVQGGVSKAEARQRARALFPLFGLSGFENEYPFALSGGMRQRAALLRTVLTGRDVLLLDEPFGALDALTRSALQGWLLDIQVRLRLTILFVTHDVEEALLLSDRVYVLSPRPATVRLVQEVALPRPRPPELTTDPAFVALKRRMLSALREMEVVQ